MNHLKCLLVSPPIFYENTGSIWESVNSNFPPLGLASIAGYVREKGHSVRIIDCNVEAPSVEFFEKYLKRKYSDHKIDVIGITAMTSNVKKAYRIAEICKKQHPESMIVMGGVHVTFLPEEALSVDAVDCVVIGEGELTFEEILSRKELRSIDGIAYKRNGKVMFNKERERIHRLDDLPMPAYDLLPIRKYRPAKGTYKKLPAMSMITSRGCPGRCSFCNKTLGYRMAFKSAKKILEEIRYLHDKYGIQQILFYDDTFTVFRTNVIRFCKMLIESDLDIAWTCFARVDYVDPEMLALMKKSGCHQIMYGVENIDETVIKNINKKITKERVEKAVRWTKREGIECRLSFMVGNPGDSLEVVEKNIEFAKKVNPDLIVVNITTPFPGTEMFRWAKEKGLLLSEDWDDYNLSKQVMRLENLNDRQIRMLYKIFYKRFYFRFSYIIRKVFSVKGFYDIEILFEGFRALLSFLYSKNENV